MGDERGDGQRLNEREDAAASPEGGSRHGTGAAIAIRAAMLPLDHASVLLSMPFPPSPSLSPCSSLMSSTLPSQAETSL